MTERDTRGTCQVVLVVDDEACVLDLCAVVLARAGFEVLRAASAAEALRVGRKCLGSIHLMLCDVVMPGLSGPALADEFELLHPETRVLFMAGFPDNPEIIERVVARGRPFLAKPFMPQALVKRVWEVLSPGQTMVAQA